MVCLGHILHNRISLQRWRLMLQNLRKQQCLLWCVQRQKCLPQFPQRWRLCCRTSWNGDICFSSLRSGGAQQNTPSPWTLFPSQPSSRGRLWTLVPSWARKRVQRWNIILFQPSRRGCLWILCLYSHGYGGRLWNLCRSCHSYRGHFWTFFLTLNRPRRPSLNSHPVLNQPWWLIVNCLSI